MRKQTRAFWVIEKTNKSMTVATTHVVKYIDYICSGLSFCSNRESFCTAQNKNNTNSALNSVYTEGVLKLFIVLKKRIVSWTFLYFLSYYSQLMWHLHSCRLLTKITLPVFTFLELKYHSRTQWEWVLKGSSTLKVENNWVIEIIDIK